MLKLRNCNDLLLITNEKHNKWERIQSFVNVFIFSLTIFVFVATIDFIITIVKLPTYLMLQLASIMILPALYLLFIPIFIYNDNKANANANNYKKKYLYNILYYYLGFIIYYSFGSLLSLAVYIYTFYYLDDLNWNKFSMDELDNNPNKRNTPVGYYKLERQSSYIKKGSNNDKYYNNLPE